MTAQADPAALTTASVTDALDDEGYTKVHSRSVLTNLRMQDKDYSCCYWVEADGQVGITTEAGRFIDAGDDGEGWVIDDEPVDSVDELLAVLRVA